ncbi:hypothetical protein ACSX1A_13835 [Pontibacter sp. MBLB2868]|uniref:hypothetical protein n=1 Tax=Pontibacter sp. MBLB2868 TaxID=3451555 RepID=UPI003F74F025
MQMQEISYKLFTGAYDTTQKTEQRVMLLAAFAIVLQLALIIYLAVSKTFSLSLVVVFLINVFVSAGFLFHAWLDKHPRYRRHLTLTEEGVLYRSRFMQPEQEFDWNEIDQVRLELLRVVFLLKNEEEHVVSLEQIQNDSVLKQVKEQIKMMVIRKNVTLA